MAETEPFSLEVFHSMPPGIAKFLYLPSSLRSRILADCMVRAKEDADYFLSEGKTLEDFEIGTVLPSGNTVIVDEKGRKLIKSPEPNFLKPKV